MIGNRKRESIQQKVVSLQSYYLKGMEKREKTYTEKEAYLKLSALCAMSERCCHDIMKKMQNWDLTEKSKAALIARLLKEGFVDEERYARAFARDKFAYNHWGKRRIVQELKMRQISSFHIDAGLQEIDEKDHLEALREMIAKKRPSVKGKSEYEVRGKLIRFALGRGFELDDIMKVVGSMDECDQESI